MQCSKCSAVVLSGQNFCEACGAPVAATAAAMSSPICNCPLTGAMPDAAGLCEICGFQMRLPGQALGALKFDFPPDLALMSDIGRHHPVNQDSGMAGRSPSGTVVMVVADGVSSADKADVASAVAVAAAYKEMMEGAEDVAAEDIVRRAITVAHAAVMAIPYTSKRMEEPETTIVAALVRGRAACIGWVGDSRAYTIHGAHSRLISRDDSWLADAVESGSMTLEQALADNRSHSITQCLGMLSEPIRIHVRNIGLDPDTWLLLCTDGLWNYFDQPAALAQAVEEVAEDADAFELCQHLVRLANHAGGYDNISVAAYRLPIRPGQDMNEV